MTPMSYTCGRSTKTFPANGTVSREKLHLRTCELAGIAGRAPSQVSQVDYEQAKRELTGETDLDRQVAMLMDQEEEMLESQPEFPVWDPESSATGHQVPEISSEDAEPEGHNESAQLVEQGITAAEREQKRQAARVAESRDPPES